LITQEHHLIEDMRKFELEIVTRQVGARLVALQIQPTLVERIKAAQVGDSSIFEIKKRMENGRALEFHMDEDDVLRYRGKICVPGQEDLKKELLREAHYSSYSIHPGGNKMYYDLKKLYWWNNMKKEIAEYVSKCHTCQMINIEHRRPAGELKPLLLPQWKWEYITMDFVSALPRTRDKYDSVWVIVDRLTKVAHFIPIKTG